MITPIRYLLTGLSLLTVSATLFLAAGCAPKKGPEKFTAQLTEIEGVQAIYTVRHPKLILADLDKLMTEVPETALLRMFLGPLAPFGYPEFSELTAGSNIGLVVLEVTPAELSAGKPTVVGFAQLKEGGKIWTALTQKGLTLQKHSEWTWIAQDPAAFAQIKSPAAITAHLARPQTEEIRGWGRATPALLAQLKSLVLPKLETQFASRPADEQKALVAYFDVLWSYLAQLHSANGSLDLNDQGLTVAYSAQFLPDSPTGTWLRYAPGPAPKIAQSVPADGLVSVVIRQNVHGLTEFASGFLDKLIAVDYPAASESLKALKTSFLSISQNSDGGGVLTMSMSMPVAGQPPEVDMLGVQSGEFTEAQVNAYYRDSMALSKKFTNALLAGITTLAPGTPTTEITQDHKENALVIDGISFGTVVTTTKTTMAGAPQISTTTQYYGVVGGNFVYAMNEDTLRKKLPALVSKKPVANPVSLTLKNDEIALASIHGEKIVDMVAESVQVDLTDADIQAQIKTLKDGYAAHAPVTSSFAASQAQGSVTFTVPYKFIAQSIRLGQFAGTHKKPAQ